MTTKITRFNEYQLAQLEVLIPTADLEYALLNLAGEVGELSSVFAKARLKGMNLVDVMLNTEMDAKLKGEIGDVLFMITLIATKCGLTIEDMANMNIEKLRKRKADGTIIGNGDFERTKL